MTQGKQKPLFAINRQEYPLMLKKGFKIYTIIIYVVITNPEAKGNR